MFWFGESSYLLENAVPSKSDCVRFVNLLIQNECIGIHSGTVILNILVKLKLRCRWCFLSGGRLRETCYSTTGNSMETVRLDLFKQPHASIFNLNLGLLALHEWILSSQHCERSHLVMQQWCTVCACVCAYVCAYVVCVSARDLIALRNCFKCVAMLA